MPTTIIIVPSSQATEALQAVTADSDWPLSGAWIGPATLDGKPAASINGPVGMSPHAVAACAHEIRRALRLPRDTRERVLRRSLAMPAFA